MGIATMLIVLWAISIRRGKAGTESNVVLESNSGPLKECILAVQVTNRKNNDTKII
jgi:hypothetical protein